MEMVSDITKAKLKKQMATTGKEKEKLKHRETELQAILRKLYEDNALGKISDEQFMALSKDFTTEQTQIKEQLKALEDTLNEVAERQENTTKFLELVREYTDIQELTKAVLNGGTQ